MPRRCKKLCLHLKALQFTMCSLTFHPGSDTDEDGGSYSRAERGTETEADPFSTTEVLVFKTKK